MSRKLLTTVVTILMMNLIWVGSVGATTQADSDARAIEKVQRKIDKIGTGLGARVEITLRDDTRVNGYISQATKDSFVVIDGTGTPHTTAYSEVKNVRRVRSGGSLSKAARVAVITVGVTATLFIVGFFIQRNAR